MVWTDSGGRRDRVSGFANYGFGVRVSALRDQAVRVL